MADSTIEIRVLCTLEEYQAAERLQQAIWQMPDHLEVVPLPLLVTAQKNGGLVLGAFDRAQPVGMLFGFLGRTADGLPKHCSHMMGVLPSYRGRGIGRLLKQRQQELVQAQGIDLITWTYDPLETANALLNISRLGAICRTYLRNVYGEMSDELNRGLPTDRFEVEWWANNNCYTSLRVGARIGMESHPIYANQITSSPAGFPVPGDWQLVEQSYATINVPGNFQQLKAHDLDLAQAWRLHTRTVYEAYFAAGFVVIDFKRSDQGDRTGQYLLTRLQQATSST